ncbi:hypothetical protein ES708_14124 [subsurface metagenome]
MGFVGFFPKGVWHISMFFCFFKKPLSHKTLYIYIKKLFFRFRDGQPKKPTAPFLFKTHETHETHGEQIFGQSGILNWTSSLTFSTCSPTGIISVSTLNLSANSVKVFLSMIQPALLRDPMYICFFLKLKGFTL